MTRCPLLQGWLYIHIHSACVGTIVLHVSNICCMSQVYLVVVVYHYIVLARSMWGVARGNISTLKVTQW